MRFTIVVDISAEVHKSQREAIAKELVSGIGNDISYEEPPFDNTTYSL